MTDRRLISTRSLVVTAALGGAAVCSTACAPTEDAGGGSSCAAALLAGDLVISEVQADLPGADDGREWFEIANATAGVIDLAGVTLAHAASDGTAERTHQVVAGRIDAGGYFVVGAVVDDLRPAYVDYGFADDLGALRNTNGSITLRCGARVIDTMTYAAVTEGASYSLDGASAPDHTVNDDAASWCDSTSEYGSAGERGTPGAANDRCVSATSCNDRGSQRAVVAPALGDLVMTEVMANPSAVGDSAGEWFEVHVTRPVDLNGLQVGKSVDRLEVIESPDCLAVDAGDDVLLARDADPVANGGLPPVDVVVGVSLSNTDGALVLAYEGALLDEVTWASAPSGASWSLDPAFTDPVGNDDADHFCAATAPYGAGDRGTPGEANGGCLFAGECLDKGQPRAIRRPAVGDVVITELMANPSHASDTLGEWFELYVTRDIDLNDLQLGRTAGSAPGKPNLIIERDTCMPATAGSYVLLARSADPLVHGGLPAVDVVFDFPLANSKAQTLFVGSGDTVLDQVTYTGSANGASAQLDPAVVGDPSAVTLNDDATRWCDGATSYGDGDTGTPGAPNDQTCP